MNDLIKALTIFEKYMTKTQWPTHCEHDVLLVLAPDSLTAEDQQEVERLSFQWDERREAWRSYRFGSA